MTEDHLSATHLTDDTLAAYVGGILDASDRHVAEIHLADCSECRATVLAVDAIRRAPARRRSWMVPLSLAAAAALVLVTLPAIRPSTGINQVAHRAADVASATVPLALAPRGAIAGQLLFTWSAVRDADGYRVRVLDGGGSVVWEAATADTTIVLPDTVSLLAEQTYFWQVRASVGIDRWVSSDLIDFSLVKGADRR